MAQENTQQTPVEPTENTENPARLTSSASKSAPANESTPPAVAPVILKQGSGKGAAAGALVLSLIALACAGLLFVEGQNVLANAKRDYQGQLDKAALGQSDNARLLHESLAAQQNLRQDYTTLRDTMNETRTQLDITRNDYRSLVGSRMQWMVNEVEYTLNTTAQQLMLSGNTRSTIETLNALEKRLNHFDAPELLPTKQALSQDLKALAAQPTVDLAAASLRLDKLQAKADTLPLLMDKLLIANTPQTEAMPTGNASWYENLWQGVKNNLGHLVEVRKINNPEAMMLSPEQTYFVRQNIKLRLLDARLALFERQPEVYRSDVTEAVTEVSRYFDNNSPAVRAWLDEANALREVDIRAVPPDVLKNSLAAVRTYQNDAPEATLPAVAASEVVVNPAPASAASSAASAASAAGGRAQ